ncbi:hypothetical protein [Reinekea blandensis]|uniref:Porin domain-containing protein n=1 Tax=Reinekea blandensis MED297 TaxID=314283 RepID=A4BIW0_9GAMM|nr:hypothetical protein [Reinekea blandensis]EAR07977.1 hypothetical protein MED297_04984 [Reinekea sp. MED297] [Reinekea blandensis MED297]
MKAIFAVSALAAAISAQAIAADTEATTEFTGAMDAQFILDMNADPVTYDVDLKEDDYNYGITMETTVVNGPFSGSIGIESDEGATDFLIGDLVVTDGKLSFGQVGSLMATDTYVESINEDMEETALDVDVAFRYMVSDELSVQLQGLNFGKDGEPATYDAGTKTGLAAAYASEAGALSFAVEGEAYFSGPGADADLDPEMFAGAGVTYTTDAVTVMGVVNYTGTSNPNDDNSLEYVVAAESTFGDASVKASYQEPDTAVETNNEIAKVEVAYTMDAITASAGYMLTTLEDAGDEAFGKVAYAADAYEASAKVILANLDAAEADDPKLELRASTTSDAGVTYYAEYDFKTDVDNKATLGAKYSF